MSIKLYIDHVSQPCRAVLSLCKFGKLNIELVEKRLSKSENTTKEMLELNPLRTLPFIVDNNNLRLTESHSIMRYLCKSRRLKDNFYPSDIVKSSLIDEYLGWHPSNTRKFTHLLGAYLPDTFIFMKNNDKNAEFKKVKQTLYTFENYFLKDNKFINNMGEISIADISAICEFINLEFIDFSFKEFPKVDLWISKMKKYKEIQEAHEVFYKVLKKFREKQEIDRKKL